MRLLSDLSTHRKKVKFLYSEAAGNELTNYGDIISNFIIYFNGSGLGAISPIKSISNPVIGFVGEQRLPCLKSLLLPIRMQEL